MKRNLPIFSLVGLLFLSVIPKVYAVGSSGFENASYSAKTLGQANATVARPEDPSTVSFNPAGIIDLPGIQTMGSLETLNWRIFHRNQVTGDFNQDNNKLIYIPTFYSTINPGELLDNRFAMGVGINSPFGLSSSFPSGRGMGHYTGWDNRLKMIATTLSGSARLAKWFNIGASAINYNIYDYGQQFNYPNAAIVGGGASDGKAYTETSGNGWGWNLGILLKPLPKHKLAASYRSKATVEVDGRVVVEDLVLGLAQGYDTAPHYQSGAHSDVPLPANITIGYAYEPSEKWSAEFDFGFTWWEVFADQNFTFDRPNATINALGTIPRNYDNSLSIHLGGRYAVSKKMDVLGGFAFYEAASPKRHVDNFLPDANRYLWSLGTHYKINDRMDLDFTYFFMLFGSRHISNPGVLAKTGESIDGRYTSIINAVMLSFTYKFDFPFEHDSKDSKDAAISPQPQVK